MYLQQYKMRLSFKIEILEFILCIVTSFVWLTVVLNCRHLSVKCPVLPVSVRYY